MAKNDVYERDYAEFRAKLQDSLPKVYEEEFYHIVESGILQKYDAAKKALPKYINPTIKAAYENLLSRLDMLAKLKGGKIRGIVDYEDWEAHIDVVLPYFECCFTEDFKLLGDIMNSASNIAFTSEGDGNIHLSIMFRYFEDIGDKKKLLEETIKQDDKLVELLDRQHEEEKKIALAHPQIASFLEKLGAKMGMSAEGVWDMLDTVSRTQPDFISKLLSGQTASDEEDEDEK